jgi:hypothetical protein
MTYRDDVAALSARHDALATEVATKTRELESASRLLEEARAKARLPVLDNIRVASPCTAEWSKMTGDERVRHCGDCKKNVFNLSEMTREEAETLILAKEGRLCVRYFQRKDGTILLKDCEIGVARGRRRKWIAAGAAVMVAAGGAGMALRSSANVDQHDDDDDDIRAVAGGISFDDGHHEVKGEIEARPEATLTFSAAKDFGKRDQLSPDAYAPNNNPDFVFDLRVDTRRPIKNIYVVVRGRGQQWDTLIGKDQTPAFTELPQIDGARTWHLGVREHGRWVTKPDGSLPMLGAGAHQLELVADISGGYTDFEAIVELDDGTYASASTHAGMANNPKGPDGLTRDRIYYNSQRGGNGNSNSL